MSALDRCRLFVSRNVEETQARIAEVMQPHRLRPSGRALNHRAHMDFIRLDSVGVGAISFGEMALELEEVLDYHLVIFCRQGSARFVSGRRSLVSDAWTGACFSPGQRVHGEFSDDCEQIVFRIDGKAIRRFTGGRRPVIRDQIDLRQPAMRPWGNFVKGTFGDPHMVDLLINDRRTAADCESLLLSLWLSGGLLVEDADRTDIAPASVKRAEAFIDTHYAEPITLQDVAAAACVPVRTLLDGFRQFRGISPMAHLKDRRLLAVRRQLLSRRDGASVSSIAFNAGFSHLGRFAADYAGKFGERPSDSLRR